MMGMYDVGPHSPKLCGESTNRSRTKTRSLIDADDLRSHRLGFRRERSRLLETGHADSLTEPSPLADQIQHDAFQTAYVERKHGMNDAKRFRHGYRRSHHRMRNCKFLDAQFDDG